LAAYLKISPVSVYDAHYLSLGNFEKVQNLGQLAVILLSIVPLITCRLDRINLVLCSAGLMLVAFHGLTTNEIMGYNARFYAPTLPFFFTAALRGLTGVDSTRKKWRLVASGVGAGSLALLGYRQGWIDNGLSSSTAVFHYLVCLAGTPAVGFMRLFSTRAPWLGAVGATLGLSAYQIASTAPAVVGIVSDAAADFADYSKNSGAVGVDRILRCFEEPLQLMHSELGIVGVLFPESRIVDFTGLANPAVANDTFDFEQFCATARPEFIFRPHVTHERLNRELDSSHCLAENYSAVPPARYTSCPLHVRSDLLAKYLACQP
jgi:hypothetical protein